MSENSTENPPLADVRTLTNAVARFTGMRPDAREVPEALAYVLGVADDTVAATSAELGGAGLVHKQGFGALLDAFYAAPSIAQNRADNGITDKNQRYESARHVAYFAMTREMSAVIDQIKEHNGVPQIIDASRADIGASHKIAGSAFAQAFPKMADALYVMRLPGMLRRFDEKTLAPLAASEGEALLGGLRGALDNLKATYPDAENMTFFRDAQAVLARATPQTAQQALESVRAGVQDSVALIEKHQSPQKLLDAYKQDVAKGADSEKLPALAPQLACVVRRLYAQDQLQALHDYMFDKGDNILQRLDAHAVEQQKKGAA